MGNWLFEAAACVVAANDLYDAAFAMAGEMECRVVMPVWQDPLVVAIPARQFPCWRNAAPLEEVVGHPLAVPPAVVRSRKCERPLPPGGDTVASWPST